MKFINLLKISSILTIVLISLKLNASGIPYVSPQYGVWCEDKITALDFLPGAMVQFDKTELVLEQDLYLPVYQQINESSLLANQTIAASLKKVSKTTFQQHNSSEANAMNSLKVLKEQKRVIDDYIEETKEKEEKKAFNDEDGEFTKKFFKNLCSQSKIAKEVFGSEKRAEDNVKISASMENALKENNQITSVTSKSKKDLENRYKEFCSEEDNRVGLCEDVSEYPNSDLDFNLFFTPSGNVVHDTSYRTKYTYNDDESYIASKYIDNLISFIAVEPPTAQELNSKESLKFVSYYKSYVSSLNLSRAVFIKSHQDRKAITDKPDDDSLVLSKLDYFRYVYDKYVLEDKNIVLGSNKDSMQSNLYLMDSFMTKLQLELYSQQELDNMIEAALLSLEKNNPLESKYMESIK